MGGMSGTSVDLLDVMILKMKTSKRAINLTWNNMRIKNNQKKRI
jgi:1,6-anhydro-N-acetylmuramate kinase